MAGCADSPADATTAEATADITKRINPNSSSAAFELGKPSWNPDDYGGGRGFTFDNVRPTFGESIERLPGNYPLNLGTYEYREQAHSFYGGYSLQQTVPLTVGFISVYTPAAISVARATPVSFGTDLDLVSVQNGDVADSNYFVWGEHRAADPLRTVVFAGKYRLKTAFDDDRDIVLQEGDKADIVLPVATVTFAFDPINADFPGAKRCSFQLNGKAGGQSMNDATNLRQPSQLVFPAGPYATLAYCNGVQLPLPAAADLTVRMNRLEVNDVSVTSPDGSVRLVHGTFAVDRKDATAGYLPILTEQTHMGVDLPDGTYRVTSTAPNAPPHVVEVSFP
jgi:hypothetical protein